MSTRAAPRAPLTRRSRPGSAPVRVAIANDYALVIAGLGAMLAAHADRVRIVQVAKGTLVVRGDVDLLLYDSFGSPADFRDVVAGAEAKVVVYSWNTHPDIVAQRLAQGASGYLSKKLTTPQLLDALEAIADGHVVTSLGHPAGAERSGPALPPAGRGLSAREAEVLALITQGLPNTVIATHLFISINSVKTYIRSAYRKMGVDSRSQAVSWGISHGFESHRVRVLPAPSTDAPG